MENKRRKRNSAATRDALIAAARHLFAERGYAGTATEEVVAQARVSRGALYHHFRDKRDLFAAVLDREQKRLATETATASRAESEAWRAMVAAANAFLDACLDPAIQRILFIDAPAVVGPAQWREADQGYYLPGMKSLIRAAIDRGEIENQPAEPLAHIIYGALHEAALLIALGEDKPAARRLVDGALARMFAGLRGSRDSAQSPRPPGPSE